MHIRPNNIAETQAHFLEYFRNHLHHRGGFFFRVSQNRLTLWKVCGNETRKIGIAVISDDLTEGCA